MNADPLNDFAARTSAGNAIVELEQRLLGWQLRGDPGAIEFASAKVRNIAQMFQVPHNRIQAAILKTFDAGRTVSVATIPAELSSFAVFTENDGPEYLRGMADAAPVTISADDVRKQMAAALSTWRHLLSSVMKAGDVEIVRADTIEPVKIDWVWPGWLAKGKFHLIAGSPGTGKTTLSLAIAATITNGGIFPCGAQARRGSVLMWTGEDDLADSIVPRLLACGGDRSCMHFVAGVRGW